MSYRTYTTEEGLPGITWEQDVPTGETTHSRRLIRRWKISTQVGFGAALLMLYNGLDFFWALLTGALVTGMAAAPDWWRALSLDMGTSIIGPPPPMEPEQEALRRARVTHFCTPEVCWAEVRFDAVAGGARLALWRDACDPTHLVYSVPLDSFAELELSTADDWFGDATERELARLRDPPHQWMIVAVTAGYGVLALARSGRSRAQLAELHHVLGRELIGKRRQIATRIEELAQRYPRPATPPAPDHDSEEGRARAHQEALRIRASMITPARSIEQLFDNTLFGFALRLCGRLRDTLVSAVLGILTFVLWIALLFGGLGG